MVKERALNLVRGDAGQDMVEYALVAALIALGATAGLHTLADALAAVPAELMQKFISTAY